MKAVYTTPRGALARHIKYHAWMRSIQPRWSITNDQTALTWSIICIIAAQWGVPHLLPSETCNHGADADTDFSSLHRFKTKYAIQLIMYQPRLVCLTWSSTFIAVFLALIVYYKLFHFKSHVHDIFDLCEFRHSNASALSYTFHL